MHLEPAPENKEEKHFLGVVAKFVNRPDGTPLATIMERNSCSTLNSRSSTLPIYWTYQRTGCKPIIEGSADAESSNEIASNMINTGGQPKKRNPSQAYAGPCDRSSNDKTNQDSIQGRGSRSSKRCSQEKVRESQPSLDRYSGLLYQYREKLQPIRSRIETRLRRRRARHSDPGVGLRNQYPRRAFIPDDVGKAYWQTTGESGKVIFEVSRSTEYNNRPCKGYQQPGHVPSEEKELISISHVVMANCSTYHPQPNSDKREVKVESAALPVLLSIAEAEGIVEPIGVQRHIKGRVICACT